MSNVAVQKIRDANQARPILKETIDLLDKVRMRAFELFQKRGGVPGHDIGDWLEAEKEVFRVPDMELAEIDGEFQLQLAVPGFDAKDIRVAAPPRCIDCGRRSRPSTSQLPTGPYISVSLESVGCSARFRCRSLSMSTTSRRRSTRECSRFEP